METMAKKTLGNSSEAARCRRFGSSRTKQRLAGGAGKAYASCSCTQRRQQSLKKWNRIRRLRRAVCAPAISFVDLIKHQSTTRSLCSSTLVNIQTKSWFFMWNEMAQGLTRG